MLKMRSKNLKKVDFLQKTFFSNSCRIFSRGVTSMFEILNNLGTTGIRLWSRKEIRGAKHVHKKYSRKTDLVPKKKPFFGDPIPI